MRKKLLLSTAALLAGIAVASAQGTTGGTAGAGKGQAGAASQERQQSTQGHSGQAQQGSQQRAQEQGKSGQSQRSEQQGQRKQTTGHGAQGRREQSSQGERSEGMKGQAKPSAGREREQTTGQNQREPSGKPAQSQNRQPNQAQGQAPQRETQGQAPRREPEQGQAQRQAPQPSQPQHARGQAQGRGNVALSTEQRTRIRESVLTGSNVPRVDNVNFSLSVGTAVPASVRVMEIPDTLIAIYPDWRGDEYFVVRDDLVIVDQGRRIVAMLPIGSSSAQASERSRFSSESGAMNLSQEEIRELQISLNEKGFNVGEPDGRLGPRTNRALMEFQQRQGLQATGRIDQRTVQSLGINVREQQGGSVEPSSTDRAGIHSSSPRLPSSPCLAPSSNQEPGNPPLQGSPAAPCRSLRPTPLLIQIRPRIPEAAEARCRESRDGKPERRALLAKKNSAPLPRGCFLDECGPR
jgi:Putative peptidoglycan binding domain/Protein of unknown function (DUF1236)